MKNKIVLMALLACSAVLNAQIQKGSIYAGLSLGFSSTKTESSSKSGSTTTTQDPLTNSNWNFMPEVSYFIMDNFSIGANVGMAGDKTESSSTNSTTKTTNTDNLSGLNFGVFGRKYWNCTETFHTFVGLGFTIINAKGTSVEKETDLQTNISIETTDKAEIKGMRAGLEAGFAWQATPRVLIMGSWAFLGYNSLTLKTNIKENGDYDQDKVSGFTFDFSSMTPAFNLGFAYRLNK